MVYAESINASSNYNYQGRAEDTSFGSIEKLDDTSAWQAKVPTAGFLMGQFVLMTAAFGLNHGAMGAAFDTATAFFGDELGSNGTGTTMFFFAFSALLAPTYLPRIGSCRLVLALGMIGYTTCLLLWLLALIPSVATSSGAVSALVLTGSVFSGVGAGMLFVSESVYMTEISEAYAFAMTRDSPKSYSTKDARGLFGSIFATVYITLELVSKLLASFITSEQIVYGIYFGGALIGTIAVFFFLKPTPQEETGESTQAESCRTIFNIPRLLMKSLLALLALVFYNATFGFAVSYQASVVSGILVVNGLGKSQVGFASSIVTAVAAICSAPLTFLSNIDTKSRKSDFSQKCVLPPLRAWVLSIGPLAYMIISLLVLSLGSENIESMGWSIIATIEVFMGIGRASWDATMLVAVAQWFQKDLDVLTTAMSSRIFFNALGSGITFYASANASYEDVTLGFLAMSAISIVTILAAGMWYSRKHSREGENEK